MKILKLAAVAASAFVMAAQARAAVVFDFKGTFASGARSGEAFSGTLAYDPATPAFMDINGENYAITYYENAFKVSNLKGLNVGSTSLIGVVDTKTAPFGEGDVDFDGIGFVSLEADIEQFQLRFSAPFDTSSGTGLPTFDRLNALTKSISSLGQAGLSTGTFTISAPTAAGAVPEPATWAMMIGGMGMIGGGLRARRRAAAPMTA